MDYASSVTDASRRSAVFVDKILKGAKPGDLPVEEPTKYELVINLIFGKHILGFCPRSVLARQGHGARERRGLQRHEYYEVTTAWGSARGAVALRSRSIRIRRSSRGIARMRSRFSSSSGSASRWICIL